MSIIFASSNPYETLNYVWNPSAEGPIQMVNNGNATPAFSTAWSVTGNRSFQFTALSSNWAGVHLPNDQRLEVTVGDTVNASMTVWNPAGTPREVTLNLRIQQGAVNQDFKETRILAAGQVARFSVSGVSTGDGLATIILTREAGTNAAAADVIRFDNIFLGFGTSGDYFDGSTESTIDIEYLWTGDEHGSPSAAILLLPDLELEPLTDGVPRIRLTLSNVRGTRILTIKRSAGGFTSTVPGLYNREVTGELVITDWAAPLNLPVTYIVEESSGILATGMTQLDSAYSWVQDPLHPDSALPVMAAGLESGRLTMDENALRSSSHPAGGSRMKVMGSRYPRQIGGQREYGAGLTIPFYSLDEETGKALIELMESPVVLMRPARTIRPLPPTAYMSADLTEEPLEQMDGPDRFFTRWTVAGDLVHAVMQMPLSGDITYEQVQQLLGQYTYDEIQAAVSATTYLDWQKNPYIFTELGGGSMMLMMTGGEE